MTIERNGTLQTLITFPSYLTTSVFLPWLCKLIKWMFSSICSCIHLPFVGCSRKPQALLNCTIWPLLSMQLQCKMLRNPTEVAGAQTQEDQQVSENYDVVL